MKKIVISQIIPLSQWALDQIRKALPDLIKRSQQGRAGASIHRKAKDLLMIY